MKVVEAPAYTPSKAQKHPSKPRKLLKRGTGRLKRKTPQKGKKRVSAKKPKSYTKLLKEADSAFSKYVRLKYADQEGNVSCYTCGHRNHYKKMQNGHYISRFYKKYRFDERNTRPQCAMCNMWKSGDIPTFRMKLVEEGVDVQSMEADYKELFRLDAGFLEGIIIQYKKSVENLDTQKPDVVD